MVDPFSVLNDAIAECQVCRGFAEGFAKPPRLDRGGPALVMVIGQGPGSAEAEQGRPFAGGSGTRLDNWLVSCGADPADPRGGVYLTSVIKCVHTPLREASYRRMAKFCRPFLRRQIELVMPEVLVSLGAYAYDALRVTDAEYSEAIGELLDTADHVLVTDLGLHYKHLTWPHPSGLNRQLNDPKVVARLEASFPVLRPHITAIGAA